MKKKISVLAAVSLGVALLASACGGPFHRRADPERFDRRATWAVERSLSRIDATDEQKEQALALKDQIVAEARPVFEQKERAKAALLDEWRKDAPDAGRVHGVVDETFERLRGFAHRVADAGLEVHRLLTPEQRARITERLEARVAR